MGKVIEINAEKLDKMAAYIEDFPEEKEKEIEIKSAILKDGSCNYSYELLHGLTKGDELARKGVHIVHDDMYTAFKQLDVFFAHVDGAFHWANNQTHIDDLEAHEDMNKFSVYAFKITGSDENRSVIISGNKDTTIGSVSYNSPKIKLAEGGAYLYVEELRDRMKVVIEQVEAYMNGKTAPQYEQLSMDFDSAGGDDSDFDKAKIE